MALAGTYRWNGTFRRLKTRPLRHRLEMVHGLHGLHLGHGKHLPALVAGVQNRVREDRGRARANRSILLQAGVDTDLEPAAIPGRQQADDAVMLELLAHRPDQNRTH